MTTNLKSLAWQDSCDPTTAAWVETQTPSGDWLRIKKRTLGGYLVTRFGADKMRKSAEVEMSADEAQSALLA